MPGIHHTNTSDRLSSLRILGLLGLATLCGGCLGPRQSHYVTARPINVTHGSDQADRLWRATGDALRTHGFTIDRTDWRAGVITTLPETSRSVFEFWRCDVQTDDDLWESTLNPIRRWIEVRLAPDETGLWRELTLVVHKQRLSSLDRQFNSTGSAYQYFGSSLPSTTGLATVSADFDQWIDIGDDPALAERLLTQIWQNAGLDDGDASDG